MGVICEESGEKGMDNAFMESYSDALNKELSMTTIEKSFARAPHPDTSNEVILSHSISWLCLAQILCTSQTMNMNIVVIPEIS